MNVDELTDDMLCQIRKAHFKVAVTGAGVSRASGLPLLTDTIAGVPLREFFRPQMLDRNPEQFYDLYRLVWARWGNASPNAAHMALAKTGTWVITQNVDGLHRLAGSEHVIELHGNFRELKCPKCSVIQSSQLAQTEHVPRCPACSTILRPAIVLEGERVRHVSRAMDWVGRAQVLWIVGTHLKTIPASDLPHAAADGVPVVWVNEESEKWLPRLMLTERTR